MNSVWAMRIARTERRMKHERKTKHDSCYGRQRYANMWNRVKYFNSHFRMPGRIRFRSPTPPQLPPPSSVVLINVPTMYRVRASYVCSIAALSISICHSGWNLCVWVRHVYKLSDANELCYGSLLCKAKLHIVDVVVVVVWMRATKIEKW